MREVIKLEDASLCYLHTEGEKNHKKGGLNCVFKNFSSLRSEELFPGSESEIV